MSKASTFAIIFCCVLVSAIPSNAQTANEATVQGSVRDRTGAVVPGVTITLTPVSTGTEKTAVTDANRFALLWFRTTHAEECSARFPTSLRWVSWSTSRIHILLSNESGGAFLVQKCRLMKFGTVANVLAPTAFRGRVHVAPQDQVAGPFIGRARRVSHVQLGLGI